jgi:hypothetical protein
MLAIASSDKGASWRAQRVGRVRSDRGDRALHPSQVAVSLTILPRGSLAACHWKPIGLPS